MATKREAAAGRGSEVQASAAEKRRDDVPALTGLRFLAAFSVLISHSLSSIMGSHETPLDAIYWIRQVAGFGMTLFFVLSGFVIHYNYATLVTEGGRRGIAAFLWARFARLYPLFLLMMVVYTLLNVRHPERYSDILRALPYFLLSVQSWFYVPIGDSSLINTILLAAPTWSISTEWFFYFAYPLIAFPILRARQPSVVVGLVAFWCTLWMAFAAGVFDRTPGIDAWAVGRYGPVAGIADHQQDSFVRWLNYFSPYLRIGEFVLGALTAQLYIRLQSRKAPKWENAIGAFVFVSAAASVVLVTYLEYDPRIGVNIFSKLKYNFALAPSAALMMFTAARYRSAATSLLTSPAAIVLGEASYSIYLLHEVVLGLVFKTTKPIMHGFAYDLVLLLLTITTILLLSIAVYSFYEAPARKWLRQRWDHRRAAAAPMPHSTRL
jgi:peptidoglycan/LPS O-acetylase OafA/YrhL